MPTNPLIPRQCKASDDMLMSSMLALQLNLDNALAVIYHELAPTRHPSQACQQSSSNCKRNDPLPFHPDGVCCSVVHLYASSQSNFNSA
jgi:hypothetical protein